MVFADRARVSSVSLWTSTGEGNSSASRETRRETWSHTLLLFFFFFPPFLLLFFSLFPSFSWIPDSPRLSCVQEVTELEKKNAEDFAKDRAEILLLRERVSTYEDMEGEVDAALNLIAQEGTFSSLQRKRQREREREPREVAPLCRPSGTVRSMSVCRSVCLSLSLALSLFGPHGPCMRCIFSLVNDNKKKICQRDSRRVLSLARALRMFTASRLSSSSLRRTQSGQMLSWCCFVLSSFLFSLA